MEKKLEYEKPELKELETGHGQFPCMNGSAAAFGCHTGAAASFECIVGSGAQGGPQ